LDLALLIIAAKVFLKKDDKPIDIGRPECGPNSKAVWNTTLSEWQCVFGLD